MNQYHHAQPGPEGRPVSYKVSIWKIEKYSGKRATTYSVRWTVERSRFRETFGTRAAADAYRAELLSAYKRGEPFDRREGKPVSWLRESVSWFDFACSFVDMKWPRLAGNSRRSVQEALTDATEVLLRTERGKPDSHTFRAVLRDWAFSTRLWGDPVPEHLKPALVWLERNTLEVSALTEPELTRRVLDRLSRTQSGKPAAANTANRKRMVLNNAFNYACERGLLPGNPFGQVQWTRTRAITTVDPGVVVNPGQAKALLAEVLKQGGISRLAYAFLALLYYAALRPEEAICLTRRNLHLPSKGWGEIRLADAEPSPGTKWTEGRQQRERRQLKHRGAGEGRRVPIHPELVAILRWHIAEFKVPPGGRLFIGPRGGIINERVYMDALKQARDKAFSAEEAASPLARTPYDLRHAAVSTWLASGVPAPQVAEWAGHSVAVLLRVYAKCVAGQEQATLDRIQRAMDAMSGGQALDSEAPEPDEDRKEDGPELDEHEREEG